MIIGADTLHVSPTDRDVYVGKVRGVADQARRFLGCLGFAQSPDPNTRAGSNVFERWEFDGALLALRSSGAGGDRGEAPKILGADLAKHRISTIGAP